MANCSIKHILLFVQRSRQSGGSRGAIGRDGEWILQASIVYSFKDGLHYLPAEQIVYFHPCVLNSIGPPVAERFGQSVNHRVPHERKEVWLQQVSSSEKAGVVGEWMPSQDSLCRTLTP